MVNSGQVQKVRIVTWLISNVKQLRNREFNHEKWNVLQSAELEHSRRK